MATIAADGQTISGSFTSTLADPTGKVIGGGGGSVRGTCIRVEPLGTPIDLGAAAG